MPSAPVQPQAGPALTLLSIRLQHRLQSYIFLVMKNLVNVAQRLQTPLWQIKLRMIHCLTLRRVKNISVLIWKFKITQLWTLRSNAVGWAHINYTFKNLLKLCHFQHRWPEMIQWILLFLPSAGWMASKKNCLFDHLSPLPENNDRRGKWNSIPSRYTHCKNKTICKAT